MARAPFSPASLRDARHRAGLSQGDLADLIGVSHLTRVSLWERGLEQPRPEVVPRLAAALGIDALDLYEAGPGGPSLAVLRHVAGMSIAELARRTGIPNTRYHRIENGLAEPAGQELPALAGALGVKVGTLRHAANAARSPHRGHQKADG